MVLKQLFKYMKTHVIMVFLVVLSCQTSLAFAFDNTYGEQLKTTNFINSLNSKGTNNEQAKEDIENLKKYYLSKNPDAVTKSNILSRAC